MKVRCITSFAGYGFSHAEGEVFELPPGVDWLRAGFVVPVAPSKPEALAQARKPTDKPYGLKEGRMVVPRYTVETRGRWAYVIGPDGVQVNETGMTKAEAEAEAKRLNSGGT